MRQSIVVLVHLRMMGTKLPIRRHTPLPVASVLGLKLVFLPGIYSL